MTFRVTFAALVLLCAACGRSQQQPAATTTPAPAPAAAPAAPPAIGVYVTNETGGDLSVIDAATNTVVATIPLGKRPRGIVASPDRTLLYVALSGSAIDNTLRSDSRPAGIWAEGCIFHMRSF